MSAEKKSLKFQLMMSPADSMLIDDWAWQNRFRSKAEAIRHLVKAGIEHPNQALLEVALLANAAVDQLFAEGGFDGIYNSAGKAMSCTALNELQSKAKAAIKLAGGDA